MFSVERPVRRWLAALVAAWLAVSPAIAAADGIPETLAARDDLPDAEVALPISAVPLDGAAGEAVQIRVLIAIAARRRGVDGALMLQIAECESRLDPRVRGPNGAAGLFQIIPSTWEWATGQLGLTGASPIDPVANVEVAAWLMATLGPDQWPSC